MSMSNGKDSETDVYETKMVEDEFDLDSPAFIDVNSADVVEVKVDESPHNMDDDDDDDDYDGGGVEEEGMEGMEGVERMERMEPIEKGFRNGEERKNQDMEVDGMESSQATQPDQSFFRVDTHTDSVYTVAIDIVHKDHQTAMVQVVSGGGDDKAFLTVIQIDPSDPNKLYSNHYSSLNLSLSAPTQSHKDTVSAVAFNTSTLSESNPQKMLAVGSYDGTIQIWNVPTVSGSSVLDASNASDASDNLTSQYQLRSILEGPTDIEWLAWHPKGGTVLLAGSTDGTVWMYHALTSKCLQVFVGHEGDVTCGTFTVDGKFAVTAGMDGTLRIWAPRTGLSRHVFRFTETTEDAEMDPSHHTHQNAITCMSSRSIQNSNGNSSSLILCGTENGLAHLCHVGTKKVLTTLQHAEQQQQQQQLLPQQEDTDPLEKDFRSVEAVGFYTGPNHLDLYNWCATAGVNGLLKIWDLGNNGQCRQICTHYGSSPNMDIDMNMNMNMNTTSTTSGITQLKWHPTLPLIFTATTDAIIRLWDARTGQSILTLTAGHSDIINDLDIHFHHHDNHENNHLILAAASDDAKIRLYHVDVTAALNAC